MTRRGAPTTALLLTAVLALAACGQASEPSTDQPAAGPDWRLAPRVVRVARAGGVVILSGTAQPGARVVMRDAAGTANAATADAGGAFSLRLPHAGGDLMVRPEDQHGQQAMAATEIVMVLAGGPAVALSPGQPSRRLDGVGGLGAVDSDGRMVIVSGRGESGPGEVRVRLGAGSEMVVPTDALGQWSIRVDAQALGATVTVDGVEHSPVVARAAAGAVTSTSEGWLIGWAAPDGAALATWIPAPR